MIQVNSYSDLTRFLKENEKTYLLLFKKRSDKSDCAFFNIQSADEKVKGINIFYADVARVRDIHLKYNVTTVPSLLEFENGQLKNIVKGCNDTAYYKALFEDTVYHAETKIEDKLVKRVTVYSTPSCSWCNALKSYLKMHRIRYTEIDVSRDQHIADELVKRSGQMGVPQTDINGEIVVGFNKTRINELLGIQG
jgi:glutaredoxin-like YruB-family protein